MFGGGVDARADLALDRAELAQVHREIARPLAQLASQLTQFFGELRSGVLGFAALRLQVFGELIEPIGLAVGSLAHVTLLGDHQVLGIRHDEDRPEEHGRSQGGERGRS